MKHQRVGEAAGLPRIIGRQRLGGLGGLGQDQIDCTRVNNPPKDMFGCVQSLASLDHSVVLRVKNRWPSVHTVYIRQLSLINSAKSLRESTSEQSRQSFSVGCIVAV